MVWPSPGWQWESFLPQNLTPGRQRCGYFLLIGRACSYLASSMDSPPVVGSEVIGGFRLTAACPVLCFTDKLTSVSKDSLSSHTSPSQSPNSVHGSRRGSISSVSSVSSVLDEKDDDRIRCCTHCKGTLLKREQQIDEKEHIPDIVKLYEVTC